MASSRRIGRLWGPAVSARHPGAAAGDPLETIASSYPWMEREDVFTCLACAKRLVGRERVEPFPVPTGT
jgi:hypothetical protein